ncbi:Folate transporter 1 [Blattella germanica]|nr:Folate transporter 1 [Blattella germanica]
MENWQKLSLLLCVFGCLKEFRPSEPFVTHYLKNWKNFTDEDIESIFSTGTYAYLAELIFVFLLTDFLRYKPVIILDGIFAIITWSLLIWGTTTFQMQDIESIFSTGTYAYLAELIFVFLLTDFLRYKPVIILDGIFAIITWSLLIWGTTTFQMQVMEVFYSFFSAAEVAYYTYIYAQVDTKYYQKVTSYTRAAYLIGRALSGAVSELLVWLEVMDYYELNFITLEAVTVATLWVIFLPKVTHSIYFYRSNAKDEENGVENRVATFDEPDNIKTDKDVHHQEERTENVLIKRMEDKSMTFFTRCKVAFLTFFTRCKVAFSYLWNDFTAAYTNFYIVKWSFWWAFATCGFFQVLNYVQLIWEEVHKESGGTLHNGIVEALYTLIGAATSLGCGWLRFNWQILGESTLAVCSIIEGVLLIIIATANTLIVEYICYVAYGVIFHTMITVANTEVAKHLKEDSYGLIFGVNMFLALVFQTILTFIVVDENGPLKLDVRTQFKVYGGYYLTIGAIFACMAVYTLLCNKKVRGEKLWLPKSD